MKHCPGSYQHIESGGESLISGRLNETSHFSVCPFCRQNVTLIDGALIEHRMLPILPPRDPQPPEPVMAPKGRTTLRQQLVGRR